MALTQMQRSLLQKTRTIGAAREAEALSEDDCIFLVATIAADLGLLDRFPEFPKAFPTFFDVGITGRPHLAATQFDELFERLVALNPDADSFFACLGTLYKARLKYANILRLQPIPTLDQVGPRGLLQYGVFSAETLTSFLLWRKWIFDIDSRAAQETGYVFEPIIAASIGGTPVSATKSPIKRSKDNSKGRQVDCLKGQTAYEIKLRVTIAASGQGRWGEELDFLEDCVNSGYVPLLLVLDPTKNPKLDELKSTFLKHGGRVVIGDVAWKHLDDEAGPTMSIFLEKYVRVPLSELLKSLPENLPDITLGMSDSRFTVRIGGDAFSIDRNPSDTEDEDMALPDDVDSGLPGV